MATPGTRGHASWLLTVVSAQQYGLYSAFMGCFVYFFLGTSRDVTLGPTAIMSLLVSSYTFHEPAYAVLLAFLSGCIQLAMGCLCLGEPSGLPAVGVGAEVLPPGLPCPQRSLLHVPGAIPVQVGVGVPSAPSAALLCLGLRTLGEMPRASDRSLPFLLSKPAQTGCAAHPSLAPVPPNPPPPAHVHGVLWDQRTVLSWLVRVPAGLHLLPGHQRFHLRCCHHHQLRADQGEGARWPRGPAG